MNTNSKEKAAYYKALKTRTVLLQKRDLIVAEHKKSIDEYKQKLAAIDARLMRHSNIVMEARVAWTSARELSRQYDDTTPERVADWLQNVSGYSSVNISNTPCITVCKEYELWAGKKVIVKRFNKVMLELGLQKKSARILGYMARVYYKP